MKIYESIVSETVFSHFLDPRGQTLMNHAANSYGIEEVLAITSILWPAIVEDEGHIFISEFYHGGLDQLKNQFQHDKQRIEKWVNAWSLLDFFFRYQQYRVGESGLPSPVDDTVLLQTFGEVLRFFWMLRLKMLFPGREFVVEVGENIEGENGLSITFYEKQI